MRMRRTIATLFSALVLLVFLVDCTAADKQRPDEPPVTPDFQTALATEVVESAAQPGGTLVITFGVGEPRHFNPALASGSATIIPGVQIFASPLRYDENWNPQPYLAKSWEVAEDGLSVTLHLVEGATFHDGEAITSEDVAFSIQVVQQHHPFKTMFAPVTGVDTPDPYTAIIRLSRPHPAILLAMSPPFLPILPKHIYGDGQDILTHPANLKPVGSGPFKFVSYEPGKRIILERYENYFIPGRPYLDRLEFWIDSDPASQAVDLRRQVAHLAPDYINLPGLDYLKEQDHLVLTPRGYEAIGPINWLAFNLLRQPLNDVRVRQAIAYAIDPDFILQYLHQGLSQRAPGPLTPDSPFFEPDLPDYAYDPQKAARLLDEAGYPLQEDGVRFALTLDYIPITPSQQHKVATYIQHQLQEVGIVVQVRDSDSFPEWAKRIGDWDFDMTMDVVFNWGDPVIGVHRTYISDNIRRGVLWSNTQNYRNPRVDEILAQAAVELDFGKRKALYSEFQKIVTQELPVFWINVVPYRTIYHRGLGNPPLTIWGVHSPLDEVYWRRPPHKKFITPPAIADKTALDPVVRTGVRAIQLLQDQDFYTARQQLHDPTQGFMELKKSGRHVIGFTREGRVFLDNSGQLQAGMDISILLDMVGNPVLPILIASAQQAGTAAIHMDRFWPHPTTQQVGAISIWCGLLTQEEIICTLAWDEAEGVAK